jgi:hypothetical protein
MQTLVPALVTAAAKTSSSCSIEQAANNSCTLVYIVHHFMQGPTDATGMTAQDAAVVAQILDKVCTTHYNNILLMRVESCAL